MRVKYPTCQTFITMYKASCRPYVDRRFGGTYHLHVQGRKSAEQETGLQQVARHLLHAALFTLKMEVIHSSETSVHIRTIRRYILEEGNLHNYRCQNLKSYIYYHIRFRIFTAISVQIIVLGCN
jgi:hypothetical protein